MKGKDLEGNDNPIEEQMAQIITKTTLRETTLQLWQTKWAATSSDKWTRRLIPNICDWLPKKPVDVDFYQTQALSGPTSKELTACCYDKIVEGNHY